jgi:probable rRNA maturation factor
VPGWTVPKAGLKDLLQAYLRALELPKAGLSLQMVDDARSRALNLGFRSLDGATDILSFPAEAAVPAGFDGYLGDLVLDLPYAWRKRGRFHPRFEGEVAFLLLHGLLHLTGQHHDSPAQERALWAAQNRHSPAAKPYLMRLRSLRPKAVK